jgi:folate-binding protein YgfZ
MSMLEIRTSIAFRGPDAAKFLQGQLSADIEKLEVGGHTLAGLHNPQGRAIALLGITRTSAEEFVGRLPRDLADAVIARLRKYVLRAKVRIEPGADAGEIDALAAVRAGIPEIYAATSEAFVAQMLNLDLLGAIAFDKGCYTGQEVIARAHYRGRVKRRMQRWMNSSDTLLAPGDSARGPNGRSLTVVRVATAEAGQEILAVGNYLPAGAEAAESEPTDADVAVQVSGPLPLPYALPD